MHDWLEGRGERLHLVAMIDDATSYLFARFVGHDSTEENLRVLWQYLEMHGRPLEFYTDKASLFEVAPKQQDKWEGQQLPLTQITGALVELGIGRTSAHSPQAIKIARLKSDIPTSLPTGHFYFALTHRVPTHRVWTAPPYSKFAHARF